MKNCGDCYQWNYRRGALLKILNVFEAVVHQKNITGKVKIENHRYPIDQRRSSKFLTHKIFNSFHSEISNDALYQKSGAQIVLKHSMISLGSCNETQRCSWNAALGWPRWSSIHPFVPKSRKGYTKCLIVGNNSAKLQASTLPLYNNSCLRRIFRPMVIRLIMSPEMRPNEIFVWFLCPRN